MSETQQSQQQSQTQQPQEQKKPKIRLNLVLLIISAFFSESCVFMYYGLLGVQATYVFHAPLWVGTLLPLSISIVSIIIMIPIANHADRTGRRKEWILVGCIFAVVFDILMALATNWQELLLWRTIGGGIFASIMFLWAVLFIFVLGPQRRGLAVGLFMGCATAGSCLFTVLAGIWSATPVIYGVSGFSFMYYMAAIIAVIALIFVLPVRLPRHKMPPQPGALRKAVSTRGVWYPGIVFLISTFASTAILVSLSVVLSLPPHVTSPAFIGIIFSVNSALNAVGMSVGGGLADKLGPKTMLIIGGIVGGVICLAVPFVGFTWYILGAAVWAVEFLWALSYSSPSASATHSVQWQLQATAVNTIMVFSGIGGLAGSIVGGLLLSAGWTTTAISVAVILIVSGIVAIGVPKLVKKQAEQVPR